MFMNPKQFIKYKAIVKSKLQDLLDLLGLSSAELTWDREFEKKIFHEYKITGSKEIRDKIITRSIGLLALLLIKNADDTTHTLVSSIPYFMTDCGAPYSVSSDLDKCMEDLIGDISYNIIKSLDSYDAEQSSYYTYLKVAIANYLKGLKNKHFTIYDRLKRLSQSLIVDHELHYNNVWDGLENDRYIACIKTFLLHEASQIEHYIITSLCEGRGEKKIVEQLNRKFKSDVSYPFTLKKLNSLRKSIKNKIFYILETRRYENYL